VIYSDEVMRIVVVVIVQWLVTVIENARYDCLRSSLLIVNRRKQSAYPEAKKSVVSLPHYYLFSADIYLIAVIQFKNIYARY
jgi:hypothetical protein